MQFPKNSVLILLLLLSVTHATAWSELDTFEHTVSIVNLLATPERFDDKRIRVIGVATAGHGSDALYLTTDDARLSVGVNGIALSFEGSRATEEQKRSLNMKHVLVEGRFRAVHPAHFSGLIVDVSVAYALEGVVVEDKSD